jgi:hypothetical protein
MYITEGSESGQEQIIQGLTDGVFDILECCFTIIS